MAANRSSEDHQSETANHWSFHGFLTDFLNGGSFDWWSTSCIFYVVLFLNSRRTFFVIGRRCELSAVVVEIADFWGAVFQAVLPWRSTLDPKIGNCAGFALVWLVGNSTYGITNMFWGLFIILLRDLCSRSFMNRKAGCFSVWPVPFQRRFAMVFLVPADPCVHWLCPLWFGTG